MGADELDAAETGLGAGMDLVVQAGVGAYDCAATLTLGA